MQEQGTHKNVNIELFWKATFQKPIKIEYTTYTLRNPFSE